MVPPEAVTVASPSLPPIQLIFVLSVMTDVSRDGSVMVMLAVVSQLNESVTVTM